MTDRPTYPPPPPPPAPDPGERGRHHERPAHERPAFERIVPELLKRGLEAGRGTLEKNLGESFFPRDMASQLVAHIGDLRQGVVTAVAQEVGLFLREADIAAEIRQLMVGLEVEATVHLKFSEAKDGGLETEVNFDNRGRRGRRARARARRPDTEPPEQAPERESTSRSAPPRSAPPPPAPTPGPTPGKATGDDPRGRDGA